MKKSKNRILIVLCIWLLFMILAGLILLFVGKAIWQENIKKDPTLIQIDGKYYRQRNLLNILLIGIGESGNLQSFGADQNAKEADFIALLSIDEAKEESFLLLLNRDSMVQMDVLNASGERTGQEVTAQLALSHTYGDGFTSSCLNTKRAVSRLLCGIDIDFYIAITMDSVQQLTDILGGVSITMEKDYTAIHPLFQQGKTVVLDGQQALTFVTSMNGSTNILRMERQQAFMLALQEAISEKNLDFDSLSFMADASENPMILTDCSIQTLQAAYEKLRQFTFQGIRTPQGNAVSSDTAVEFYPSETHLHSLLIERYLEAR